MDIKGMIVMMTLCLMVRKTWELTWKMETLSTTSCDGDDKLLTWKCSVEKNESIKMIQWLFNNQTIICYYSYSSGFHVSPLYKDRVEQNGTMGILLKKVSSVDTGQYTLDLNIALEQTEIMQTIYLTVYEPPSYKCKPIITVLSKNVIMCSTNTCGKSEFLPEWRIFGRRDPVGNESYLTVNSSWNNVVLLCCLHGPNMQCHNGDQYEFCTSASTFGTAEVPNDGDAKKKDTLILVMVIIVSALVVLIIIILLVSWWHSRKQKLHPVTKHLHENRDEEHALEQQDDENLPMLTDQEMNNNNHIDSDVFKKIKNIKRQLCHNQDSLQSRARQKLKVSSDELTVIDNDTDTSDLYEDATSDDMDMSNITSKNEDTASDTRTAGFRDRRESCS